MDFKGPSGRVQEGAEAFPVLVRGLDVETTVPRMNSISKNDATPLKHGDTDDSPSRSRESTTFSLASELIKQRTLESGDEEDDKTKTEDLHQSFSVAKVVEPTLVDRISELQRTRKVPPEDLLMMAINEKESAPTGRRYSIWRKIGSKHRVEDDFNNVLAS